MKPAIKGKWSLADYLQLEQEQAIRYEYHDGEVLAMSGEAPKHGAIASNIIGLLNNLLTGG